MSMLDTVVGILAIGYFILLFASIVAPLFKRNPTQILSEKSKIYQRDKPKDD